MGYAGTPRQVIPWLQPHRREPDALPSPPPSVDRVYDLSLQAQALSWGAKERPVVM